MVSSASHWRMLLAEVNQTGLCSNPVRLRGLSLDRTTGELRDGDLLVPCKDRRASVCPSCSRLYAKDAWHLVAAGIRGGKGVDAGVASHPLLFVTLTAPSFGPVHARALSRTSERVKPCRPRRAAVCPHGRSLSCVERHEEGSTLLGEPLCVACFDYPGAVLWNAHVSALWVRTSLLLYRAVAAAGEMTDSETRAALRLSYLKVVEFQRRGLVHVHAVLRADGASGPDEHPPLWLDAAALDAAVRAAAAGAHVGLPLVRGTTLRRAGWGAQIDVRHLAAGTADPTTIAAYVAKYATKTVDDAGWLAHPIRSLAHLERLALRPHLATLVRTAWILGSRRGLRHLRLREHAHTLGYGGQFSSKSRRYSTTFAALRDARTAYARGDGADDFDFDGEWRFGGRGYADPDAAGLAEALNEARLVPRPVPEPVPGGVPSP